MVAIVHTKLMVDNNTIDFLQLVQESMFLPNNKSNTFCTSTSYILPLQHHGKKVKGEISSRISPVLSWNNDGSYTPVIASITINSNKRHIQDERTGSEDESVIEANIEPNRSGVGS